LLFVLAPKRVSGWLFCDPDMHTDRLCSAMLEFVTGHCICTLITQMVPYQRMQILGTKGRVEIEIPFNAPPASPCRIFVDDGSDVSGRSARVEEFPICDQYGLQGDALSIAVRGEGDVPVTLENALANMTV